MSLTSGFKIISLTDAAADRIRNILSDAEQDVLGLRVGVKNGGCAGMEYTMDYVTLVDPSDDLVEEKDVKIFIDPKAALFLLGTEMDYQESTLSSGFVFNNPNQTSACGCGESVEIKPADPTVFQTQDEIRVN